MANFYEAFAQGQANGLERQKAITQRNMLAELQQIGPQVIAGDLAATDRAYALDPQRAQAFQAEGNRQQQQLFGLAKSLKQAAANPQMQAGIYRSAVPFLKRSFGAEIPDEFDAASVMPIVDQVLAVAQNAPSMGVGGNVQSTYIDGNGNRVAILRDGSQRVLGPNNASIRVMEQEGALPYGVVTSGGRPGAVVDIGGGQAPMQGATGQYTIDPSLPPEVQQQIRAAEAAGQQVPSNMVLPARSGPVRVPTSAEKAAASEAGRLSVQQQYLPQELAARTQAALAQEAGKLQVQQQGERNVAGATKLRDAQETLDVLNEAFPLLDVATGSGLGAARDAGAAFFGRATDGARANASLRVLATRLTAKVPRFEGPQSDKDVAEYKAAAGDLANEKLPVEIRQAAGLTLRRLSQKAISQAQSGSREQGAQRTIVRRGTSNGRPVVQYSDGTIEYGN
ncbi:TPA: hypothetical protein ACOEOO_000106 [Stenotrophomonas maltophilia]|uniref:hypothetical protein n=1 Tax=Stenotrophomonas maltophilia TaxID=40324 RepID=UPI000C157207|nr:hypothetical protein [Stenotrophomonas maltophilia]MDZ5776477.1 hypothetical protein [Stenotrophomonas maltophilia]